MLAMKLSRERRLLSPGAGSPRWVHPRPADSALIYLGWGHRDFHRDRIAMHYKPGWTVCLVREGAPVMVLPDQEVVLRPGQLLLAGPDCVYGWRQELRGACELLVWMWARPFDPDAADLAPSSFEVLELSGTALEHLVELHRRTRQEISAPDRWSEESFAAIHRLVQVEIVRLRAPVAAQDESVKRMELALQWMRGHLELAKPIAALADYLQVSPATLHRLFRDQRGESPGRVFRRMKLEEARRLIEKEGWLVKQAAFRLGYRHPNDLSRALGRIKR